MSVGEDLDSKRVWCLGWAGGERKRRGRKKGERNEGKREEERRERGRERSLWLELREWVEVEVV